MNNLNNLFKKEKTKEKNLKDEIKSVKNEITACSFILLAILNNLSKNDKKADKNN
jgi:hypothetical protein